MMPQGRMSRSDLVAVIVLVGVVAVLFVTAPKSEDFWWTDAASFALNGELIHDYVASGLHQSPMAFANEWFRRYPAVTISLYPPIFPMAEAIAFSLFGFAHWTAQATVAAFTAVAAFGAYRLARTAVAPLEAAAGVLLMFATPGMLLWSRQVMMEVPSLAFLLLASICLLRSLTSRRSLDLMLATVLTLGAVYTKQTAIFAAPAFAITLVVCEEWQRLRDKAVWAAAAVGIVGLLPLAAFTLIAGRETLAIAFAQGIAAQSGGAVQPGGHLAQARAYVIALPDVVGWPVLATAVGYLGLTAWRGWRNQAEQRLAVLMLAWFGCDFVFVPATGHFEARYAMPLGVPCAMFALLLITRLSGPSPRPWAALAAGLAVFGLAVGGEPVYRMSGYDKVAPYVLQHSEQDDIVWFQGAESKNLVFSLRSHQSTPKVFLLRAEKFLVDYHIVREWGVTDRGWTPDALRTLVDRYGIHMVVLQPDFWADLPSMGRMQEYIDSDRFRQVAEFPITSEEPSQRTTIKIFVNQRPTKAIENSTR